MNRAMILILGAFALSMGCLAPVPPIPSNAEPAPASVPPRSASRVAEVAESTDPTGTIDTPSVTAVDPAVEPVSLSSPPPQAARTFELCLIRGWVDRNGPDVIAGMGRIDHATDAFHYVRLTQTEPELQSDRPAWIVSFRGDIRMAWSNTIYVNPACIVVNGGDGGFFGNGGVRQLGSEAPRLPPIVPVEPDRALPAPLP
jgi:hypothetical protein